MDEKCDEIVGYQLVIKNKMFKLIGKVLEVLENDFTKGDIELTSFSIKKEHKEKLIEIEGSKFFKKYKITFGEKSFRIEATTKEKELENNLLMFDRLNNLFKNIPVETGIGCGGGSFLFTYDEEVVKKKEIDLLKTSEIDFSKELLKEIVKMISDIRFQIKISHKNKTSAVKNASYWEGYANGLETSVTDHIYRLIEFITKEDIEIIYDQLDWTDKRE